ncbi:hypothetical protein OEIGOIKO_01114 [Streptomyces chrestomyceticus JCM 4735]|uniref:DUF309 domain-containing protein n=1 Tax=Streptomyces chrestomyceticus JCM 4735 TaxID=1306181 RepID=A0A7U9PWB3_9ACTN|nr:hypothetical protein OEIGOIKO_01114 [Streptomyces chrestomyceticus JCM 4735]
MNVTRRDEGGDPACWLDQVCQECGRITDRPAEPGCEHCGAGSAAAVADAPEAEGRTMAARARKENPREDLGGDLNKGLNSDLNGGLNGVLSGGPDGGPDGGLDGGSGEALGEDLNEGSGGGPDEDLNRIPDEAPEPPAAARDRDPEGRARNARPRDGLGRPLPYGTPGVARQPEGVERSPREALTEAQDLLDRGLPFHAHEVLEDAWKMSPEPERQLWRGLAQLAVGLTHAARGNAKGGAALLLRGTGAIAPYADTVPYGIDVPGLTDWAQDLADRLDRPVAAAGNAPRLCGGGGTGTAE